MLRAAAPFPVPALSVLHRHPLRSQPEVLVKRARLMPSLERPLLLPPQVLS